MGSLVIDKSAVIVLAGPPGCGKGTQAELLAKWLGGTHLSSGDVLRLHSSKRVQTEMQQGELVTEPEVDDILEASLEAAPEDQPWVLDGYIRLAKDLDWLKRCLSRLGRQITDVILLNIPEEASQQRVAIRKREDDKPEVIRARWQEYREKTLPVLHDLAATRRLVEVNGMGSVGEVMKRVEEALA